MEPQPPSVPRLTLGVLPIAELHAGIRVDAGVAHVGGPAGDPRLVTAVNPRIPFGRLAERARAGLSGRQPLAGAAQPFAYRRRVASQFEGPRERVGGGEDLNEVEIRRTHRLDAIDDPCDRADVMLEALERSLGRLAPESAVR